MIPANEWWGVIQHYNEVIFPAQIVFYILVVVCMLIFLRRAENANRLLKLFFVVAFGWIAIVFFLWMGEQLPAHNAQAFLFGTLSLLFLFDLLVQNTTLQMPQTGWRGMLTRIGLGLVLMYPFVGLLLGRPMTKSIVPGAFPCPTTAFALLLMASTKTVKHRWLYLLTMGFLLLWAIPFPVLIQIPKFGVYEDSIMLAAGIFALVSLFRKRDDQSLTT